MNKKGSNLWAWFFVILFILVMTSVIRNSMVRHSIYDNITENVINERNYGEPQNQQEQVTEQQETYPSHQEQITQTTDYEQTQNQNQEEKKCEWGYTDEYKCYGDIIRQKYMKSDCSFEWFYYHMCYYGCKDGKCIDKPIQEESEEAQESTSPSCQSGYINEYKCSGNNIQKKYQYSDCSFTWIYDNHCAYGCENGKCNPKPQEHTYDISVCKGSADCFVETVSYIIDGDTLDINGVRIRLALTNTPGLYEAGFNEAKQFTETLCPVGSSVLVDEDDGQTAGSYGRTIAVVYCGNYNLNEQLLELSYGQITWTEYCEVSEFGNENWAIKFGC